MRGTDRATESGGAPSSSELARGDARRPWAFAFALAALLAIASSGCTFIGLGIGSTVPHVRDVAPNEWGSLQPGTDVTADYSDQGHPREHVEGIYRGVREGQLQLDVSTMSRGFPPVRLPPHRQTIPLPNIERVAEDHGTYWWQGGLIGLGVDALVVALLVGASAAVSGIHPR